MESTLPHHESFTSADAYITSLLNFTASTPLFHQLVGGVHILDFFTSSPPLYDSILPESWRDYFETKSIDEILEILFRADLSTVHPEGIPDSLYEFAENVQRHELLREVVKNLGEVEDQHKLNRQRKLAQGMNNKKLHEVEHFARYLSTLLDSVATDSTGDSITHLVDFGSGQSYLSRILASPPHNLDLVAVESKASNIEAGKFLDERVGLTARSQGKTLKESLNGTETKKGSIKYVQHIIKDESMKEVLEALEQSEDEKKTENPGLMIISLHSCGNLIHHALNALIANDEVKAVAVVGCCYNLMTERTGPTYKPPYQKYIPAENTPIPSNCLNHHFPLSARLSSQSITLNITARMMAVQAPRNWTQTTSSDFFKRHFYRALLQRIFFEKGVLSATEPLIVGSLRKAAYMGFYEYVTSAVRKILNAASGDVGSSVGEGVKAKIKEVGLDNIGREEVESYERRYGKGLKELSIMWTLMAFCAGCVESLVVVDRWSYLKESGKCRIVKVEAAFEYGISPRNLVIVGVK
ncbi:hypothetical protein TWF788_009723 [Orbilia oligospora]|uniref:Methyltransferase domain-containing protein n=2 Tax=Orbilia oligospora TaxID=2813651 RepID=A0A6G1LV05_ORBOL|nr:hypothetical protein TWF788_009723 [Orbilia oligospora]KAF3212384.1 hypothetical protein TWF191_010538 [Orbilia oligospora]KAF3233904.1 hypothetical protein TWF192_001755 [Orbilia oligospora]